MNTQLKQHTGKLILLAIIIHLQLLLSLSFGETKSWNQIDWLDIAGEGGAVWLCLVWLALLVCVRPSGPVTNLLFGGFACFLLASGQDLLDEVVRFAPQMVWNDWAESIPMPIGMVLMTLGMVSWYREQQALNLQLQKRERGLRDHRHIDQVTGLANAQYLRKQLSEEICQARHEQLSTALLMVDIDGFRQVNQRLGVVDGDRLLRELTEILLLNLRRRDLLCRYAGDRFAVVLPATCQTMATLIAGQLEGVVQHFAFRASNSDQAQFHTVSIGVAVDGFKMPEPGQSPAVLLLEQANYQLAKVKDRRVSAAA